MKKKTSLLIFFAAFCTAAYTQLMPEKYQTETIYLTTFGYMKNGVEYPSGLFSRKLKKEMAVSPDAVVEFRRFEKNRNIGLILAVVGFGSYLASQYWNGASDGLRNGLLLGGAGLTLGTIPLGIKSNQQYHKAIWLRNGAVLR